MNGQFVVERPAATPVDFPADEPLSAECRHFIECVEARRTPRTDGRDAWRVLTVLEASQRSLSMNGEPVALQTERIFDTLSRKPEFQELRAATVLARTTLA